MPQSIISAPPGFTDIETATFVTDWVGFAAAQNTTWDYTKIGNQVVIHNPTSLSATSNSAQFFSGATDVPASIRPATGTVRGLFIVRDNGVLSIARITVTSLGLLDFSIGLSGVSGFQLVGLKGFEIAQQFAYQIAS